MNEVRHRKERTDRKCPPGDIERATKGRSQSFPAVENPVKRPSRACSTGRRFPSVSGGGATFVSSLTPPLPLTSWKVSNDNAFSVERPPSLPSASRTGVNAVSLTLGTSVPKERLELRSLWEMAAVINFFCVFRRFIINLPEFTMDELESAILNPNSVLDTIHVVLLKGIPPAARVPLRGDTWPTVLSKKFKDWWWRVAEGPCPLVPCQGGELATYLDLDAAARVRVLLALCEMRVGQDDARIFIDDSVKRSQLPTVVRKDRSGCGAAGTTFWLEEDPLMGQRLYREGQATIPGPPSKNKGRGWGRGRNVPPLVPGSWETVATNFEEFQEVSTRLLESRNRLEAAMGKKLVQSLMPQLEEMQKKKDRMVKKQQREAVLLDKMLQGNGLAAGRSRRERKPVTYTFDEFDRSISEAIKFTKKNTSETSIRHRFGNGVNEVGGFGLERNGDAAYGHVGYVNGGDVGVRRSSRNFRSNPVPEFGKEGEPGDVGQESHLVEADSGFSDDEIEGEAVYDDDYLAARRRKGSCSSERCESVRGDDGDDADFGGDGEDENDIDGCGSNLNEDESRGIGSGERVWKRPRRCPKVRLVNDISCGGVRREARVVEHGLGGSRADRGSGFDEQVRSYAQQRLRIREGHTSEDRALDISQNFGDTVDFRFEEGNDSHEASGYSFEVRNGMGWRLVEGNRDSGRTTLMKDDVEVMNHSGEQLVQRPSRSEEDKDRLEAGFVDSDEEESTWQEVVNKEGSTSRRQLLDLNVVATMARGSRSPLSGNEENEH